MHAEEEPPNRVIWLAEPSCTKTCRSRAHLPRRANQHASKLFKLLHARQEAGMSRQKTRKEPWRQRRDILGEKGEGAFWLAPDYRNDAKMAGAYFTRFPKQVLTSTEYTDFMLRFFMFLRFGRVLRGISGISVSGLHCASTSWDQKGPMPTGEALLQGGLSG